MPTHVELYEALKPHIGEEAAEMIAEVVPPAKELATKSDILELKGEIARLETKVAGSESRLAQKLLAYSIPIWATVAALAIAIVGLLIAKT